MKYALIKYRGSCNAAQELLNEKAREGWEIVSVSCDAADEQSTTFLITLRRAIVQYASRR